jgi:hypothetical protein
MTSRTGIPSLMEVARRMCGLITAFTPIIIKLYPSNTALQTALSAANTACQLLHEELAKVRAYGD